MTKKVIEAVRIVCGIAETHSLVHQQHPIDISGKCVKNALFSVLHMHTPSTMMVFVPIKHIPEEVLYLVNGAIVCTV